VFSAGENVYNVYLVTKIQRRDVTNNHVMAAGHIYTKKKIPGPQN